MGFFDPGSSIDGLSYTSIQPASLLLQLINLVKTPTKTTATSRPPWARLLFILQAHPLS